MLKRLKVWSYVAALTGFSMLAMGCGWFGGSGWWPYNTDVSSIPRILAAILREDIGG